MIASPACYRPAQPEDLIGPARKIAAVLMDRAREADRERAPMKLLFYGSPGLGKSVLAGMVAMALGRTEFNIERFNGKQIDVERVRGWMDRLHCRSMFDGYQVWLVDEADTMSKDAQNLLLTFLDQLKDRRAFIATSNLQLQLLQERFHTRFQKFKVGQPSTEDMVHWLVEKWKTSTERAVELSIGSGLNVRAALMDLQTKLDEERSEA